MLIKCDPKPVTSFSVNIGNNQIAHTNCTKYLEVIPDDKLSWYCCDRKSRAACAQSFTLWQQATIEIT